jgi:hypothetical protein
MPEKKVNNKKKRNSVRWSVHYPLLIISKSLFPPDPMRILSELRKEIMDPWKTRASNPIIPAVIAVVLTEVPSIAVPFSTIWEKR